MRTHTHRERETLAMRVNRKEVVIPYHDENVAKGEQMCIVHANYIEK